MISIYLPVDEACYIYKNGWAAVSTLNKNSTIYQLPAKGEGLLSSVPRNYIGKYQLPAEGETSTNY